MTMEKKPRTLKQRIEEHLGMRNWGPALCEVRRRTVSLYVQGVSCRDYMGFAPNPRGTRTPATTCMMSPRP
jgi:hypothetical protein